MRAGLFRLGPPRARSGRGTKTQGGLVEGRQPRSGKDEICPSTTRFAGGPPPPDKLGEELHYPLKISAAPANIPSTATPRPTVTRSFRNTTAMISAVTIPVSRKAASGAVGPIDSA